MSLRSVDAQLADQEPRASRPSRRTTLAVIRYKAGLGNYLQVLNAQTAVLQQQALTPSCASRELDLDVALMRALGGGYRAEPGPTPIAAR